MARINILNLEPAISLLGNEYVQVLQPNGLVGPNNYTDKKALVAQIGGFATTALQSPNVFYGGPASGPDAAPMFRALVNADIPTLHTLTFDGAGSAITGLRTLTFDAISSTLTNLGQIIIGTTTATPVFFSTVTAPAQQIAGTDTSTSYASLLRFSNNNGPPRWSFGKSRGTSIGAFDIVANNDIVGAFLFEATDGAKFIPLAFFEADVDGTPALNNVPGRLLFGTFNGTDGFTKEALRIDSNQRAIIAGNNIASMPVNFSATPFSPRLQVASAGAAQATFRSAALYHYQNSAIPAAMLWLAKSRNDTLGAHTIVSSGDRLGSVIFSGSDGAAFQIGAEIRGESDGTAGVSDMPGRLMFLTTPDGADLASEAVRIDSSQRMVLGGAAAQTMQQLGSFVPSLQLHGTSVNTAGFAQGRWSADATGASFVLAKSRGASVGTHAVLQAEDIIGSITATGSDGTDFEQAAQIRFSVDTTPGNNDMPGRIAFFTTPDGSISALERLRIDNAGNVVVGGSATVSIFPFAATVTPRSQVLGTTAATSSTLTARYSGDVNGPRLALGKSRNAAIGAHTIVQAADLLGSLDFYGSDGANLINGAWVRAEVDGTPGVNDMPGRLAFGTTADGSADAVERMRIDNQGNVVVGGTSAISAVSTTPRVQLLSTGDGANSLVARFSADATGPRFWGAKSRNAALGGHTIVQSGDSLANFRGLGSDGTNFIEAASIGVVVDGTPGANDMPGRLVFTTTADGASSATERMRIDNIGNVVIGGSAAVSTFSSIVCGFQHLTAGTSQRNLGAFNYENGTGAAVFIFNKSRHGTLGSHTVVQSGDACGGVYFAGSDGTGFIQSSAIQGNIDGTPGTNDMPGRLSFYTTADGASAVTEHMRIDNQGNIIALAAPTTPPTLAANGQWVMTPTSNTNMRISYRGTDGTTRVANITLA